MSFIGHRRNMIYNRKDASELASEVAEHLKKKKPLPVISREILEALERDNRASRE